MSEQPGHDPDGLDLDPVPGADVSVAGRSPRHDEPTTLAERSPRGSDEAGSRPEVGPSTIRAAEEPTLAPRDGTGGHITGEATADIRRDAAPPTRAEATLADGPAGSAWNGGAGPAVIRDFGDYQIVRELARGGMGVVFLARQRSLNRPVAIKMILAGQLADETEIRRFYAEAEAAANLDHPGIVPIYEVGNHEGQHYFSMGFVEGQSLAQRMAGGPLPPLEAAALILRVADAIAYAHRAGVIHRDLKPANILLDKGGNPRVTDFGLAKKVQGDSGLTGSGQVLGTPSYMPPEQAWGKQGEVGPAADVYAIGATLYALVTHRPPFQAATAMDILVQVIGEEPVPPRRLNPAVPMDLDTIILKCLEKEPSRRYPSAMALADDLRRYLAGETILARPVSAAERLWKWVRRRPAIASLAAMAILATALGIGGILWQWGRAENNYAEAEVQRRIAQEKTREATEKAELLERQNYINLVALAQRENLANNVGYAERLLDRCPPRLRGWEWGYVNRSDHRELFSVGALPRPYFLRASLDPDATRVVCSGGNDVWIYDLASGRPLHHLKGHEKEVRALAWSPDGATVASGGMDMTIRLWDPMTGAELAVLRGHGSWVFDLAFSPDGQRLLAGAGAWPNERSNGAELKLWDYRKREARSYTGAQGNSITSVAFSPDGRTIAAGDSLSTARIWDVESGRKVRDFAGAHQMPVMNLAFRRDGRMLATVSEDGTAALWDVATGTPLRILRGHTGTVAGVAVSPHRRRRGTGSADTTIRLWDPDNGREAGLFRGHHGAVNTLQFDRAGTRLLSSGEDGVAKVWDPSRAADPPVLEDHRGWAFSAAFRPGAQVAVTGGWGVIHFWDAASGRLLRSINGPHPREVMALAYSPDGTSLASAGKEGTIKLWDAEADSPRLVIKAHNAPLYALASSPDGASLASGDQDGQVRIWDAATGALKREFRPHAKDVVALAFSPDGRRLATVSLADNVKVWDVASDAAPLVLDVVTSGPYPIGNAVAFSADGRIAVPRADHRVAIFDARDGRPIRDLSGHTADVNVVAFAPDGRRLATAGEDRTIRLWDPETGEEMFHLRGHTGGITWITWSADGRRILTTSKDRTGRLWDSGPPTGEVIRDR